MKNKFTFSVVLALFLGMSTAFAQQKIAYADQDSILVSLPEFKGQQKILESYGKQLQATLADKEKELQTKYAEFQQGQGDWIPEVLEEKAKEIRQMEQGLQEFQQNSQLKFSQKREEILSPLMQKIQDGIDTVAKEGGYNIVLPISMLLYADKADDITNQVITKLGGTVGGN